MKKYNENIFTNNIIKKYNVLVSKKLTKSKSYSKIDKNTLILNKTNHNNNMKNNRKKFLELRNFSSKNKLSLMCLKKPNKSNFVQNILNEIIPKNIRKPYGIKNINKLPDIYNKTEPNVKKEKNKKKFKNKIVLKNINFKSKKIENVTNKYFNNKNQPKFNYYINKKGKFISNFLSPYNQFISNDFNLTNKEYYKLINNINDLNMNI